MSGRGHRLFILFTSIAPLLGLALALTLLWGGAFGLSDLVAFAVMYVISGIGVSVGYHRLLAHRSFATSRPLRLLLVSCGAIAGQAPPITWAAHHRRHHSLADKPGDPHSPHGEHGSGIRGSLAGLWHAHLGWLFERELASEPLRWCPDLARDPDMRLISRWFPAFVAAGIALPALLGFALAGSALGAVTGALWGGIVRLGVSNHVTYAVNSIGHSFGRRRFPTPDQSRNVSWLALLSFGEAWHNNHHAFPTSARHGLGRFQLDPSWWTIRTLERLGLAWGLVRVSPERIERRREAAPA